jgi:hypothetical protein
LSAGFAIRVGASYLPGLRDRKPWQAFQKLKGIMSWLRRQFDELVALLCLMVGITPPEDARKRLLREEDPKPKDQQP